MKAYKTKEKNNQLRNAVKIAHEHYTRTFTSCKYWNSEEFVLDIMHVCDLSSFEMAKKVLWIIRADGDRDKKATEIFGFNKHTA